MTVSRRTSTSSDKWPHTFPITTSTVSKAVKEIRPAYETITENIRKRTKTKERLALLHDVSFSLSSCTHKRHILLHLTLIKSTSNPPRHLLFTVNTTCKKWRITTHKLMHFCTMVMCISNRSSNTSLWQFIMVQTAVIQCRHKRHVQQACRAWQLTKFCQTFCYILVIGSL